MGDGAGAADGADDLGDGDGDADALCVPPALGRGVTVTVALLCAGVGDACRVGRLVVFDAAGAGLATEAGSGRTSR